MKVTAEEIGRICHEVNRAYCDATGDTVAPPWDEAPEWQRDSVLKGVQVHLDSPELTPEQSHEAWLKYKEADGWTYGPDRDDEAKKHPCFLPYHALPTRQRMKDYLFKSVVNVVQKNTDPIDLGC